MVRKKYLVLVYLRGSEGKIVGTSSVILTEDQEDTEFFMRNLRGLHIVPSKHIKGLSILLHESLLENLLAAVRIIH